MKPYDVGVVCGRFQTFHIGHESLIDTALLVCDRVLILVGSSQESGTERNPLDIATRIKMLKTIYGDRPEIMIHALPDLTNENDITHDWGRYVLDNVDRYIYKAPEVMVYGNDEARSKWFATEDIKDTTEIIVNRGRIPISATMVRDMMVKDDRRTWQKYVNPRLHKMYNELREELMSVEWYKNRFKELNKEKIDF